MPLKRIAQDPCRFPDLIMYHFHNSTMQRCCEATSRSQKEDHVRNKTAYTPHTKEMNSRTKINKLTSL